MRTDPFRRTDAVMVGAFSYTFWEIPKLEGSQRKTRAHSPSMPSCQCTSAELYSLHKKRSSVHMRTHLHTNTNVERHVWWAKIWHDCDWDFAWALSVIMYTSIYFTAYILHRYEISRFFGFSDASHAHVYDEYVSVAAVCVCNDGNMTRSLAFFVCFLSRFLWKYVKFTEKQQQTQIRIPAWQVSMPNTTIHARTLTHTSMHDDRARNSKRVRSV